MVRDDLARKRTVLANERTVLAYIRTALTFIAVGAGFVQFFGAPAVQLVGWIFIAMGIGLFVIGIIRFKAKFINMEDRDRY